RLTILGSSSAVPDAQHDNTHFIFSEGDHTILVDCGGNPILSLQRAGISFDQVTGIVLTHFHPDHVSGLPLLLMGMWLRGRTTSLKIYGIEHTIKRAEAMMALFDWKVWPRFYPVSFVEIAKEELIPVIADETLRVFASPVKHLIPTIGLRLEFPRAGKTIAYSGDTEPCPAVARLAKNADILLHEATGASTGHSSPEQAAEIGQQAGAKTLYLIHYPPNIDRQEWRQKAQGIFTREVILTQDFLEIKI
ncbi:MAG: MBL fold metallo-hydrolase, partial [Anaerolineaceae bacterium]|nr:MBL fold metallo-hydrolase [Anaerolineaceae bacterium]